MASGEPWWAMVNPAGEWFYPDNPSDAAWFAIEHEAGFAYDIEEYNLQFKLDTLDAMIELETKRALGD